MATIIKRLEELDTESENLRAKITENNKHIDERKATIVRAERVFRSRKMEIDEMEAVEYQEGIDTTIMVIQYLINPLTVNGQNQIGI